MSNIAWDNTKTMNLRYNHKHDTNITCNKNKAKSYEANNNYNKVFLKKREKYWWSITRNIVQPNWVKSHHNIFKLHLQPGVVLE